jgi:hypothetical protein
MCELLPLVYQNNRRKYSNHDHSTFADMLFSFMMTKDLSIKAKILKACHIEKTILFSMLDDFYVRTAEYTDTYNKLFFEQDPEELSKLRVKLQQIEQSVSMFKHGNLYSVLQNSRHCYKLAQDFKGMIIEKYIRLSYNESAKAIRHTSLKIDQEDLFKNLLLSVSKAIDKYDPEKGALTTYVRWWFMDGINQSTNNHEYGTAFSVPTAQRKKLLEADVGLLNLSASLDECEGLSDPNVLNVDEVSILEHEDIIIRRMLRHADPSGMAMLALNIQYTLDEEEEALLRATMH